MKRYVKWVALVVCITLLVTACFIPYGKVLAFQYENSGDVLVYADIPANEKFQIRYTHSVHRTPVTEYYRVNEQGKIVQTKLAYEKFAIGMPSNATGEEEFVEKDGVYYITNMRRKFPYVDLRIGQVVSNHTLILEKAEIPLKNWVEPGTWVRVEVRPISLWQRLKGEDILG